MIAFRISSDTHKQCKQCKQISKTIYNKTSKMLQSVIGDWKQEKKKDVIKPKTMGEIRCRSREHFK